MAEHENKDHVSDTLEAGMDTAGDIANNAYNHYKDRQNVASGNTPKGIILQAILPKQGFK